MMLQGWLGADLQDLDTPVPLLDLDLLERNIDRMAAFSRATGCHIRPHVKSHKTPLIARKQLDAGAIGVTCSKLAEAEVMVAGGINHILLSTEIVGARKIARLISLSRHADISVVVDNRTNAQVISQAADRAGVTLGALVDVNVGQNRCGVEPGTLAADLAEYVTTLPSLRFDGLQGYEGHLQHIYRAEERKARCHAAMTLLLESRRAIERRDLPVRIVSTAGTGTCAFAAAHEGVTEVQPGSYVLMDCDYAAVEGLPFEVSLTVLTSVLSRPRPGVAIVDAGMKTVTIEAGSPKVKGMMHVEYESGGDEHGILRAVSDDLLPPLGARVELVPSHCDTTVNLHDAFFVMRDGRVQGVWRIAGRGCVQ